MSVRKGVGRITAYAAAVSAGYKGTYKQFCEDQANFAENAAAVAANLEESKAVLAGVNTAGETQVKAVQDEGTAQVKAVGDAAEAKKTEIAGLDAVQFDVAQDKSDAQKKQARTNIDAAAQEDVDSLSEAIDDLKRIKAGAIVKTASGDIITLDNTSDQPLLGLRVFGKSTQDGMPTPDAPIDIVSVGDDGEITLIIEDGTDNTFQYLPIATPDGLCGIPVTSGGNYTDANGQMWICDEVDFGRGVYIKRLEKYMYNGGDNEIWKKQSSKIPYVFAETNVSTGVLKPATNGIKALLLCDKYPVGEHGNMYTDTVYNVITASSTASYIYIKPTAFSGTTQDEFKAWLADNPFTVVYVLAEPVETPLTESEMAAYRALHTNKPNTIIYTYDNANVFVEYALDTETYINNCTEKDYVTPQMFGAVGDGATDDTAAFISALNTNKPLFIPFTNNEIYIITETITVPQGKFIFSNESTSRHQTQIATRGYILFNGTGALFDCVNGNIALENIPMRGVKGSGHIGIINLRYSGRIYDCSFRHFDVAIQDTRYGCIIDGCKSDNCVTSVYNASDTTITDCHFIDGTNGIVLQGTGCVMIDSTKIDWMRGYGIKIGGGSESIAIDNCLFDHCQFSGLRISAYNSVVSNCMFLRNGISETCPYHIEFEYCHQVSINNITMREGYKKDYSTEGELFPPRLIKITANVNCILSNVVIETTRCKEFDISRSSVNYVGTVISNVFSNNGFDPYYDITNEYINGVYNYIAQTVVFNGTLTNDLPAGTTVLGVIPDSAPLPYGENVFESFVLDDGSVIKIQYNNSTREITVYTKEAVPAGTVFQYTLRT